MEKNNKFDMRIQKGASVYHKKKKISLPVLNICKGAPFCVRMEASYMAEFSIALQSFYRFFRSAFVFLSDSYGAAGNWQCFVGNGKGAFCH